MLTSVEFSSKFLTIASWWVCTSDTGALLSNWSAWWSWLVWYWLLDHKLVHCMPCILGPSIKMDLWLVHWGTIFCLRQMADPKIWASTEGSMWQFSGWIYGCYACCAGTTMIAAAFYVLKFVYIDYVSTPTDLSKFLKNLFFTGLIFLTTFFFLFTQWF